jgi:hypothetical protein
MKTLDCQELGVVNRTRSNPALRICHGQLTRKFAVGDLREVVSLILSIPSL